MQLFKVVVTIAQTMVVSSTMTIFPSRCGIQNEMIECGAENPLGACCSQFGYCGRTDEHCKLSMGCQSGCVTTNIPGYTDSNRCGPANNGLKCNPQGEFGGCCSRLGFCGIGKDYCLPSNGCISGCDAEDPKYSDSDRCGSANKGLLCNPNFEFGNCCSASGYCGSTDDYCLPVNGCQSGCTVKSTFAAGTTTIVSSTIASSSASSDVAPSSDSSDVAPSYVSTTVSTSSDSSDVTLSSSISDVAPSSNSNIISSSSSDVAPSYVETTVSPSFDSSDVTLSSSISNVAPSSYISDVAPSSSNSNIISSSSSDAALSSANSNTVLSSSNDVVPSSFINDAVLFSSSSDIASSSTSSDIASSSTSDVVSSTNISIVVPSSDISTVVSSYTVSSGSLSSVSTANLPSNISITAPSSTISTVDSSSACISETTTSSFVFASYTDLLNLNDC